MPDQDPDLARRVLAHERILQFLIAELADTDPPLLDRMALRLAAKGRQPDAYAEQFIGQVRKLNAERPNEPMRPAARTAPPIEALARPGGELATIPIGVRKRGGVWEVRTEKGHLGDYRQRGDAIEAALNEVGTRIDAGNVVDLQVEGRPFAIARKAALLRA